MRIDARRIRHLIRPAFEWPIAAASTVGHGTFFDTDDFPWVRVLEENWKQIRSELEGVLADRERIPTFQEVSPQQQRITQDDSWRTFFLRTPGYLPIENRRRCPRTAELLEEIPGITSAFFSILGPGKHVPSHRGPFGGILRYHLALIVPEEGGARIRVGSETRHWEEGKSLIFDDSNDHEAWNEADSERVVLFVDFIRPIPRWIFPVYLLNQTYLQLMKHSTLAKQIYRNLQDVDQRASDATTPAA